MWDPDMLQNYMYPQQCGIPKEIYSVVIQPATCVTIPVCRIVNHGHIHYDYMNRKNAYRTRKQMYTYVSINVKRLNMREKSQNNI